MSILPQFMPNLMNHQIVYFVLSSKNKKQMLQSMIDVQRKKRKYAKSFSGPKQGPELVMVLLHRGTRTPRLDGMKVLQFVLMPLFHVFAAPTELIKVRVFVGLASDHMLCGLNNQTFCYKEGCLFFSELMLEPRT